jgi:lipoate-protein ligase B
MTPLCLIRRLGIVPYAEAFRLQKELVEMRVRKDIPDTLLLLEHPPVITLGRTADRRHLLGQAESIGAEVVETDRGGGITYHGPGQLVGYPVFDLSKLRQDVKWYVERIEEAVIRAIGGFGVCGERTEGCTGVWVNGGKLCAIGVRVSRWVASHGFALNVNTNLDHFSLIVPCGISDKPVVSLRSLLGRELDMNDVQDRVAEAFGTVFGRRIVHEQEGGRRSRSRGGQAVRPRQPHLRPEP